MHLHADARVSRDRLHFIRSYLDRFSQDGDATAAMVAKFAIELLGEVERLRGRLKESGHQEAAFRVAGTPVPQVRPQVRIVRKKNGQSFGAAYYPDKKGHRKAWVESVQSAAMGFLPSQPISGPVRCDIDLILPRPKRHFGTGSRSGVLRADAEVYHTTGGGPMGGDRDNFDKLILDSLTKIGMWDDDGQVCDGRIRKRYACEDGWTGAVISIAALDDATVPLPLMEASDADTD